jgi:hypothetical protein
MDLRRLTSLWLVVACAQSAHADDLMFGRSRSPRSLHGAVCPSLGCVPDDYCRKPCPTLIPVSRCSGPDDYCRKAPPCIMDFPRCGVADDYFRKSIPCLLCPPLSPYLYYGAPAPGCLPSNRR